MGERIKAAAESTLKRFNVPISIRVEYAHSLGLGGEIVLWGIFSSGGKVDADNPIVLGSDALIERNKTSEQVGKEAAEKLVKEIEAEKVVDEHLLDQLIPFMGLLPGSEISAKEVSSHAQTNIHVVEQFLPVKFKVIGNKIRVEQR
ncbi:hypothetical protein HZC30_05960 [Candidatus Woesearchaeota archaeon]|nr:hypothetical protein [Candidatus Woesearchaeota archaeon]